MTEGGVDNPVAECSPSNRGEKDLQLRLLEKKV